LKIIYYNHINSILVQFIENKPVYMRNLLYLEIIEIFESIKFLKNVAINTLNNYSWFSINWTPSKVSNNKFQSTNFLVFYNIRINETNKKGLFELPIIGLVPQKLDESIWLSKISKSFNNYTYMNNVNETINFKKVLINLVENVKCLLLNAHNIRTSFDYNIFMKCM